MIKDDLLDEAGRRIQDETAVEEQSKARAIEVLNEMRREPRA